jgi:hypothetical protein
LFFTPNIFADHLNAAPVGRGMVQIPTHTPAWDGLSPSERWLSFEARQVSAGEHPKGAGLGCDILAGMTHRVSNIQINIVI